MAALIHTFIWRDPMSKNRHSGNILGDAGQQYSLGIALTGEFLPETAASTPAELPARMSQKRGPRSQQSQPTNDKSFQDGFRRACVKSRCDREL
jgi:hypothetical protein